MDALNNQNQVKNEYIDLPVISGSKQGPGPFNWDLWYGSVGGRTISIPEADQWMDKINQQSARFEGVVSPKKLSFNSDELASGWVKNLALQYGADAVGICVVDESDVYSSRSVHERFAIVMAKKMRYEAFVTVPSQDAAVECLRIYHDLGETILNVADAMRAGGISCSIEHPIGDSSVKHIPLALKAGFGELGRHGSIIHPSMGPLFRIGCILTNFQLETDQPVNLGIGAFCDKCQACRIYCPADAIPDDRSSTAGSDPIGNDRYVVDTGKCFPYFATNNYCSACLAVCAYQHKKWALMPDGSVGPFPTVPFGTIPSPVDPPALVDPNIETAGVHVYDMIRREKPSPYHRNR